MNDVLDQEYSNKKEIYKLEKIAFISLLICLVYLFLKFLNYSYTAASLLDSVLIPKYVVSYVLTESFFSGLVLSFGIIITFFLYKIKKYYLVIILNAIFIVQSIAMPYILYIVNN